MEVIRADQEQIGGTIHKPMFERLMLCDYAVADMTGANPNVYYELGIRHALRPRSTVLIFAAGDDAALRPRHAARHALPAGCRRQPHRRRRDDAARIAERLRTAHEAATMTTARCSSSSTACRGSRSTTPRPTFSATGWRSPQGYKEALAEARKNGVDAVRAVAGDPRLADLRNVEAGIIVDLMLSFRAVGTKEGCEEMIALHARMPRELQQARMVREQLGFALNRVGKRAEAEKVLTEVIREFGPSSETNGLLGRVYKDLWEDAKKAGRGMEAKGHLKRAIASYRAGFEADWRDAYPGVNAVTLMALSDPPDPGTRRAPAGGALCGDPAHPRRRARHRRLLGPGDAGRARRASAATRTAAEDARRRRCRW